MDEGSATSVRAMVSEGVDIASDVSYMGAHSISSQARKGVGVNLAISFLETTSFRFVRRKS